MAANGTVYQRGDGKWMGAADVGWTKAGKRRRITVTADTERAARQRLNRRLKELDDAGTADPRTTVKAWSDTYLELAERTLFPNSFLATRSAIRTWIIPTIGKIKLIDLEPRHVRAVTDAMRRDGKAESSRRRVHSVTVAMLKAARADGYPVAARVVEVKAPRTGVNDRQALDATQASRILIEASNLPHGSRWVAAFLQGMRQGESLGLTWDQVDIANERLILCWQLQPLPYRERFNRESGFRVPDGYEARQVAGRLHLVRPKTKSGWRVVPIVTWMASALEAWREVAPVNDPGLVWVNPDGSPISQKADDAEFYALQQAAGVNHPAGRPYTIHEARHTTATLLMQAGVPTAVITAIMGHSSYASTQTYLHADIAPMVKALEAMSTALRVE